VRLPVERAYVAWGSTSASVRMALRIHAGLLNFITSSCFMVERRSPESTCRMVALTEAKVM
jgi:hypothetical protein